MGGTMELEKLKEFIEFMNENDLCELEIEEEGRRIKLKKKYLEPAPSSVPYFIRGEENPPNKKEPAVESGVERIEIKSPMVGTFYRASAPGAKPYVEAGEVIKHGDVVCIIEAMKLMNEIKTEVDGRIVEIAVENGAPVEFGQTLFYMEPV